jgi:hypothetical protein
MSITLRRLLTKLTALGLSAASATTPATAGSVGRARTPEIVPDSSESEGELDRELETDVVIDRGGLDRSDAAAALGRGLALALSQARPFTATQLTTTWAVSTDPMRRLAVARALEWAFPLVGDGLVIDHLASDPDPEIRIAAARASWARRDRGADLGVLQRLLEDPDPAVRAVADRVLNGPERA